MVPLRMIHVRVNNDVLEEAASVLASVDLTVPDAVRIFLQQVAANRRLPFEIKVPNEATHAALMEAAQLRRVRRARL